MIKVPLTITFVARLLSAYCALHIAFTSVGVLVSVYPLIGELTLSESVRHAAYEVVLIYFAVTFGVSVVALVSNVRGLLGLGERRLLVMVNGVGFFVYLIHLVLTIIPWGSKNPVLGEFVSRFYWIAAMGIASTAVPALLWRANLGKRAMA